MHVTSQEILRNFADSVRKRVIEADLDHYVPFFCLVSKPGPQKRKEDKMAGPVTIHAVPGGGHTMPGASGLKALGTTQAQVSTLVAEAIAEFALGA